MVGVGGGDGRLGAVFEAGDDGGDGGGVIQARSVATTTGTSRGRHLEGGQEAAQGPVALAGVGEGGQTEGASRVGPRRRHTSGAPAARSAAATRRAIGSPPTARRLCRSPSAALDRPSAPHRRRGARRQRIAGSVRGARRRPSRSSPSSRCRAHAADAFTAAVAFSRPRDTFPCLPSTSSHELARRRRRSAAVVHAGVLHAQDRRVLGLLEPGVDDLADEERVAAARRRAWRTSHSRQATAWARIGRAGRPSR